MLAVPRNNWAAVGVFRSEYDWDRYPAVPITRSWPIPKVEKFPSRYAVSLVMTKRGAKVEPKEVVYAPVLEVRLFTPVVMLRVAS